MSQQQSEGQRQQEQNESPKLPKPQTLSRYFGKFDYALKLLQINSKIKLGHKDSTLKVKANKNKLNSSLSENIKTKFELKLNQHKFNVSVSPFAHHNQYDAYYQFSYDHSKFEFNYEKAQSKFKLRQTILLLENNLKINLQYMGKLKKQNYWQQYGINLSYRHPYPKLQLGNRLWLKHQELMTLNANTSSKLQCKLQTSTNIGRPDQNGKEQEQVSEQNSDRESKKSKQILYKLSTQQKLNKKGTSWEYKFSSGFQHMKTKQNVSSQIRYESGKKISWDIRYMIKLYNQYKVGLSVHNKGWQAIAQRSKIYKQNLFLSLTNHHLACKLSGKYSKCLKYEFILQQKWRHQILWGISLTANY